LLLRFTMNPQRLRAYFASSGSVFKMIFVSMMASQKDNTSRVLLQSPFQATLKGVTFF
jgi:hypothetical protein